MAGFFSASYPISRSTGQCAATGQAFAPGEHFVAALVETEGSEELGRLDYSLGAWEGGSRPEAPARLFAHWRGVFAPPQGPRKLLLNDDELLDLFEQLATADRTNQIAFRYVLALLLVRRRVLTYEGTVEGVMRVRVKRPVAEQANEPIVEVVDPKLDDETVAGVIEQLGEVVGG